MLEATQQATGLTPAKARALLGRFLFSGEEAEKPLEVLSGGERRRLSLAILVSSGANVLILDEPTNHLDLESREALEQALSEFQGSLLLVSHDRALLDAVGSRTVALEDASLRSYVGGWPEYVRVREERARGRPKPHGREARQGRKRAARSRPRLARPEGPSRRTSTRAARSRRPKRRCRRSRTSWPTRRRGPGAEASARSTARHEQARRAVEELYEQLEQVTG